MNSPLRDIRQNKEMSLRDLSNALAGLGVEVSVPSLSLIERGIQWPSRNIVVGLVEVFDGELTEMDILFPVKNHGEEQ